MTVVTLPYTEGAEVWQTSTNRAITLQKAFLSAGHIQWLAKFGDEQFYVSENDIKPVPKLEGDLKEGERIQINKVPYTVIRDAFPNIPAGKGVVARKITEERTKNGAFTSVDDLVARMGLSQINWQELAQKIDFSI